MVVPAVDVCATTANASGDARSTHKYPHIRAPSMPALPQKVTATNSRSGSDGVVVEARVRINVSGVECSQVRAWVRVRAHRA